MVTRLGGGVEWADVFPPMLLLMGSFASVATIPICVMNGKLNNDRNDLLRAACAETLGRLKVVESVGPLAERLFDPSLTVREAASMALLHILPMLEATDGGAMEQQAIVRLADALQHPNTLLVFKILEALNKIGTGCALPAVETIAREGKTRQLQETARQVAVVLAARGKKEHEAQNLMRSTIGTQLNTESLMRPVNTETDDESLEAGVGRTAPNDWL